MEDSTERRRKYVGLGNDEASIGVLEGEILRHLWDAGEPQSSVQVYEVMHFARRAERREMQSPSTIAVTLSRMVQKGLLTIERQGSRKGYYAPTKTRAQVTAAVLDDTSRRLTGQPLGFLLASLQAPGSGEADQTAISVPGMQELINALKNLQSTPLPPVPTN